MKILIIGGGLFGCTAAFTLAGKNTHVDLVEEMDDIMMKASFINHNRIHLGYHYLRSIQTAEQSIEGLLSFLFTFGDSVIHQFPNYYAIANENSKTTPQEFMEFCEKVGIGYEDEFPENFLLDKKMVSACFRVPEPVWDYVSLKKTVLKNLAQPNIRVFLKTACKGITVLPGGEFEATINNELKTYDVIINASYAELNKINSYAGISNTQLLYEDVYIPTLSYASAPFGLTVMDGPFCSVMPHGKNPSQFLLYHVRESVLRSTISNHKPDFDSFAFDLRKGIDDEIYKESSKFFPFLKEAQPIGFNRTIRTVHENTDDARLSEIRTYEGINNFYSILSGKVTTCIQCALEIKHKIQGKTNFKRFKI